MSKPPVPFAPETLETIQRAFRLASDRRHDTVGLEHLLRAITDEPQARGVLASCGVNIEALRKQVDEVLAKAFTPVPAPAAVEPEPSVGFDRVVQQAVVHAAVSSAKHVDSGSLLVFMLQEEESHAAFFLQNQGLDRLTLLRVISHGGRGQAAPQPDETGPAGPPSSDPLEAYATDLVARAAAGQIDPLIGRALELERMIQVLCRRRKNNPLLVGEPGVGKTALGGGPAAAIPEGPGSRTAAGLEGLRAGPWRVAGRHEVSRRLRGTRQAGARAPGEGTERNPVHRRDSLAGGRGRRVGRSDGRRQPAEAGAGQRVAALHRLDDVQRRQAVVRSRSRAVAPVPEDRRARTVRGRNDRHPQGPEAALRG